MTQNELYDLVADHGEAYGPALRRDSYLARGIDWPENWLKIAHHISETRAHLLCHGLATPTPDEMKYLIRWQVEKALDEQNPDIVPTLWLCRHMEDDELIAVEGWGASLHTELKFKLIGRYPDETTAIKDLRKLYLFDSDEI